MKRPGHVLAVGGLAVAAFVALGAWIMANTEWRTVSLRTPLTGAARTNPVYAAARFVERVGAHAVVPQDFSAMPPPAAVLVLTSSHWDFVPNRANELRAWVNAGGRLVLPMGPPLRLSLKQWLDVDFNKAEPAGKRSDARDTADAPAAGASDRTDTAVPAARRRGLPRMTLDEQPPGFIDGVTRYEVCDFIPKLTLAAAQAPIWSLNAPSGPVVLRLRIGAGSVTVLQNPGPLSNEMFPKCDNARMFTAAAQLRPGDEVWFVAREESDPLLVVLWTHGAPVMIVLGIALALALWRGMRRFGPPAAAPAGGRRSLAEQIRGTGEFVLRHGGGAALHAAQKRALTEAAARRIPGWDQLTDEIRLAQLVRLARLDAAHAAALGRAWHLAGDVDKVPRHELEPALALLEFTRRALLGHR